MRNYGDYDKENIYYFIRQYIKSQKEADPETNMAYLLLDVMKVATDALTDEINYPWLDR